MRSRFTIWRYFLDGMPAYLARQRTLDEAVRIIQQDGRLVITEYGPLPR